MQTIEIPCDKTAKRLTAQTLLQAGCCLIGTEGEFDLGPGLSCESVRALLRELLSLRAGRLDPGWRLDRMGRTLVIGEDRVTLTRTQLSILQVLADARGDFVPVHDLLMGVWGFAQPIGGGELVRTHIRGIRKRLRECDIADDFINGSRGRGYRINPRFILQDAETALAVANAA